ncbi:MAG TPA: trypsin-like peptidase domain-containing protein [Candidatus Hydrogenedentes bacterium]|nr:trypsin-like peptidase domain-containing protein [Candidatus Hydrogenedentota bacterium]HPG67418.1 trypsin-like peptidase domain-containing protein [Candidatus Hydrogenedentota bacterium]
MKRMSLVFAFTAALVAGLAGGAYAVSPILKEFEDAFVKLQEDVRPCVVNIDTKGSVEVMSDDMMPFEDLFRFFGVPDPRGETPEIEPRRMPVRQGTGSGFIFDKEGHIITNNHVVEGADEIVVRLWDGSEHDAEVVGRDPDTDVAVIKIEPTADLPVAKLGDSSQIKVGQFAIAMGSPRGFEGSLSFGHVSALGRDQLRLPGLRFQHFIQTDAAINLGNSGGPLCNIDGEVIGINVAIVYGANSLGFAIPINTAKDILPELIASGKVTRGYLGVGIADARYFADGLNLPDNKGAFVKQVQPDTPAEKAKLKPYDVIRKVNGEVVEDSSDLIRKVSALSPGAQATLEIWRDGKAIEAKVELAEWEAEEVVAAADSEEEVLGIRVQELTSDTAQRMGLKEDVEGVLVTHLDSASAAADAGITEGCVITEVAQESVTSPNEFYTAMRKKATPGKGLLVGLIRPNGEADITVIKIPKDAKLD